MKKSSVVVFVGLIILAYAPFAKAVDTIAWGTGAFRAFDSDTTTLLSGNASSSLGGFVQLLNLGIDGIYNGYVGSGIGVVGDDTVIATTWVGSGMSVVNGAFAPANIAVSSAVGTKYEIRFFNTPSSNFGAGSVPLSGFYGTSQVFTQAGDPTTGGTDNFSFNANYSATSPVPEPSTVALMLAGLGVLGFARMRRK